MDVQFLGVQNKLADGITAFILVHTLGTCHAKFYSRKQNFGPPDCPEGRGWDTLWKVCMHPKKKHGGGFQSQRRKRGGREIGVPMGCDELEEVKY